jgi:hypothetical protein
MALRLPRLPREVAIVDKEGKPGQSFQRWWQSVVEKIEAQEASQDAIIADLAQVVSDLSDAVDAITAAQATADAAKLANAISASWTAPTTTLTAQDAGTDATITVLAHTRHYDDDQAPVSIVTADITGLAFDTTYGVYYDDAARTDTTPAFVATTDGVICRHNYVAGRHFVGFVKTPVDGGTPAAGGSQPPGGGGVDPDGDIYTGDYNVP